MYKLIYIGVAELLVLLLLLMLSPRDSAGRRNKTLLFLAMTVSMWAVGNVYILLQYDKIVTSYLHRCKTPLEDVTTQVSSTLIKKKTVRTPRVPSISNPCDKYPFLPPIYFYSLAAGVALLCFLYIARRPESTEALIRLVTAARGNQPYADSDDITMEILSKIQNDPVNSEIYMKTLAIHKGQNVEVSVVADPERSNIPVITVEEMENK